MKRIAIVFDADDTLFETSTKYIKAKKEFVELMANVVESKDLHMEMDDFCVKHAERFTKIDSNRVKTFKLDKNRFMESMLIYFSILCGHFHIKWDCEVEKKIKEIAGQVFEMPKMYEDTERVLKDLKNKGYDLFCLTAGDREMQLAKFSALKEAGWDLPQYFNSITVVPMKDVKAFEDFKLANSNYEEYYMLGDNMLLDVVPSLSVGMVCIWLKKDHLHNWNWNGTAEIDENDPKLHIVKTLDEAHKIILEKYPI